MPVIDADGLFNGDRFDLVSDRARLLWPYFWCASNTLGRLELNYHKIIGRAFARFKEPPSQEEFWQIVREYNAAYLLFVYEVDGTLWGQWDTSAKFLPRHKMAADKRTPAPDYEAFTNWKEQYIETKRNRVRNNPIACNNFVKPAQSCESFRTNVRGVGIGIGEGKPPIAPLGGLVSEEPHDVQIPSGGSGMVRPDVSARKKRSSKRSIDEIRKALGVRIAWWEDFWRTFPCHEGKRDAMDAFERKVKTQEVWAKVYAGAVKYAEVIRANPDRAVKWGQGWINAERWEDEADVRIARPIDRHEAHQQQVEERFLDLIKGRAESGKIHPTGSQAGNRQTQALRLLSE